MLNDSQQNACKKLVQNLGINTAIIEDIEGSPILLISDEPHLLHLCDRFFESQECPLKKEIRDEIREKGESKKCQLGLLHMGASISINGKDVAIIFTPAWRLSEGIPYEKLNERIKELSEEKKKDFIEKYRNIPLIYSVEEIKNKIRIIGNAVEQVIKSEELSKINEILSKISSERFDWKELITTIQDKAKEITKAERSCILLIDKVSGKINREIHCSQFEEKKKTHCEKHVSPEEGAIGYVFTTGEPLLINNTDERNNWPEEWKKWEFSDDTKSFLNIPLNQNGETIGVIHVASSNKNTFNQLHLQTLSSFAGEAVVALRNANLFKILSSLEEIGRALSSQLKLDKLLESIGSKAKEVLGVDVIVIYTYNQQTNEFNLEFVDGVIGEPSKLVGPIFPETSVKLKAIREGEPYFASDSEHDSIMGGGFVKREGIKSSAAFPLKVEDKIIGVMFVNYRINRSFSEEEKTIHRLFALQSAVAIRNAHLFKERDSQRQKTDLLSRISIQVQTEDDLDKMLYIILTAITIKEGLSFNRAMLFLHDEYTNSLKGKMAIGPVTNEEAKEIWKETIQQITFNKCILTYESTKEIFLNTPINIMVRRISIPLGIKSIFSESLSDGKSRNIKNAEEECADAIGLMGGLLGNAFAIVPLIVKGKEIGLIVADRKYDRRVITPFDLDMLSTFANQVEIAIEKKRLFDEITSRIKNLDELYKTMSKMGRPSSLDEFLESMCTLIVKTIRANCSIYLYKEDKLILQIYDGIDKQILIRKEFNIGEGIPGTVATQGLIMGDTFIGVSIKRCDEFFGVLVVDKPFYERFQPFKEDEKNFLQIIGEYITLNMTNFALIQRLEEETRVKSEILHHLSHTIRSPLGVLEMYSQKLLEGRVKKDKMDNYLKTISDKAKECLEISENLVNTSLIEGGKIEITKEEFDISSLINEICDRLSESLKERELNIEKNIPSSIKIIGDKIKIGTSIYNIINNAIKFSKEQEKIGINLHEDRDIIKVEIINYGPIISDEEKERIFEKFYQGKPEKDQMPKGGMGLGLFIAQFYIKLHNGRIRIESKPDGGTRFIIILPKNGGIE
ncbi:MAG: GAF domain-containing protein [bacterium]